MKLPTLSAPTAVTKAQGSVQLTRTPVMVKVLPSLNKLRQKFSSSKVPAASSAAGSAAQATPSKRMPSTIEAAACSSLRTTSRSACAVVTTPNTMTIPAAPAALPAPAATVTAAVTNTDANHNILLELPEFLDNMIPDFELGAELAAALFAESTDQTFDQLISKLDDSE